MPRIKKKGCEQILPLTKLTSVISRLHREAAENCALRGYYAATSGNFLQTFRDNQSLPSSVADNVFRNVGKKLPLIAA